MAKYLNINSPRIIGQGFVYVVVNAQTAVEIKSMIKAKRREGMFQILLIWSVSDFHSDKRKKAGNRKLAL